MKIFHFFILLRVIRVCNAADSHKGQKTANGDVDDDNHGGEHSENEGGHHEDHKALIDSLFKNYDSSSSPTHGTGKPTVILVNLQLLSLDDISDSRMEYIIDTRLTFTWTDFRLMTPECRDENEDCDDHFDLKRKISEMWTPDLYILNSKTAKHHDQPLRNGMVYLVADGQVFLSKRLTMTLRCPMDLVLYPLDTQGCPLLICPYSLPESELQLKWVKAGVGIIDDTQDGQNKFKLSLPVRTGEMKLKYEGPDVSGNFSCVNATFLLVRQNGYHMGYSYTVTSLIVMVSWISFWLPVTAVPARVTLGITTLLTLLTTANFVRSALPPIPYVTAIDVWVGFCILFVFTALLILPVSHFLSRKNNDRPKSTQKNRVHLFYSKCSECGGRRTLLPPESENNKPSFDVDSLCRKIFPISFIILNIVYWTYYVSRSRVNS